MNRCWDVIVVGAGHAGCEAAFAAARVGCDVLLVTGNLDAIAAMACNCSIGGPAKANLVREIDALGGEMARNIDRTFTHIRMLNTTKGPAVQALRAQADKALYREQMKRSLELNGRIHLAQDTVSWVEPAERRDGTFILCTQQGESLLARRVVIATGTFLGGLIHIGERSYSAGRAGEPASVELASSLSELGLPVGRLKTGTVPRVSLRSLTTDNLCETPSDTKDLRFAFDRMPRPPLPLLPCWRTATTALTMRIVGDAMDRSALGSGRIRGVGPRYCPSIEAKLLRFPERAEHGVFLEREGWNTEEVYVQGTSNSLPIDVQWDMVRSIPGLERAEIVRAGYAIEYDYVHPASLTQELECRQIRGLYLAGQINGSSGYEEAAAQGLVAGANAAMSLRDSQRLRLERSESYVGVLIDDLVHCHAEEPYRLLTSRAEWRLNLGQDTAHARLAGKAFECGLVSRQRFDAVRRIVEEAEVMNEYDSPTHDRRVAELARDRELYAGYRERLSGLVEDGLWKETRIPETVDLTRAPVKQEVRERLAKRRPRTVAEALSIPGITQADVSTLLAFLSTATRHVSRETFEAEGEVWDE